MVDHPFLTGNFAPIHRECPLAACSFMGSIPEELWGGQYVRNGSNPSYLPKHQRRYHWFDGDGMLSGVWFKRKGDSVEPCFVNKFLITDVFLAERKKVISKLFNPNSAELSSSYGSSILPSITTLISPMIHPITVLLAILEAMFLCVTFTVSRLSVANTSIIYHNSKALATCESGPFLTVELPSLNTIGWCEFKKCITMAGDTRGKPASFFEEWATGHPRIDPITSELIFFGSSFLPPYLRYSVVSANGASHPSLLATPIPIESPKLMHDFGVSLKHTIILDLPLTINPLNMLRGHPVVHFDSTSRSRFGIFPRYHPEQIRWFESEPCAIFHTANTWSDMDDVDEFVNTLVCRFKNPRMLYVAGNIPPPAAMLDKDICRLFYYRFNVSSIKRSPDCAFTLSAIPFEFPSISNKVSMQDARYIYGCTMREGSFDISIGGAAKVDCLVRLDVKHLIQKGINGEMDDNVNSVVDKRSVVEIIADNRSNPDDLIQIFVFDEHYFAQECTFVPRKHSRFETDGYLLTYVFDERQLQLNGSAYDTAVSELWIIDAVNMSVVVGKIRLPQRGPWSQILD